MLRSGSPKGMGSLIGRPGSDADRKDSPPSLQLLHRRAKRAAKQRRLELGWRVVPLLQAPPIEETPLIVLNETKAFPPCVTRGCRRVRGRHEGHFDTISRSGSSWPTTFVAPQPTPGFIVADFTPLGQKQDPSCTYLPVSHADERATTSGHYLEKSDGQRRRLQYELPE